MLGKKLKPALERPVLGKNCIIFVMGRASRSTAARSNTNQPK